MHTPRCSAMAISRCGKYLVTAGNKTLRVWPYSLEPGSKHQVIPDHMSSTLYHNDRFSLAILTQLHKSCLTLPILNSLRLERDYSAGQFSHSLCFQPRPMIGRQTLHTHATPLHYHLHINQLLPTQPHSLLHVVKGIT